MGEDPGATRKLESILGTLQIGVNQAKQLGVPPRVQQSPMLEMCCLRMAAKSSYKQAEKDVEMLTGVRVAAKTQERIVKRTNIPEAEAPQEVKEMALDGGMVRLVGTEAPSEWRQYKALRVNGKGGVGMAWFQQDEVLLDWVKALTLAALVYCLGDGHPGVWLLYRQLSETQARTEILDWFHLKEHLYGVGGSNQRLEQAEALLWAGEVDAAMGLFEGLKSEEARKFRNYLQTHRSRIPNYGDYQKAGIPVGSGAVESLIKQIDERIQITGARWKPENVPKMLALRCAYINEQLDIYSLARG